MTDDSKTKYRVKVEPYRTADQRLCFSFSVTRPGSFLADEFQNGFNSRTEAKRAALDWIEQDKANPLPESDDFYV